MAIGAGPNSPPLVAIRVDIQDQLGGSAPNGSGQPSTPRSDGKTDFTSQIFEAYSPTFRGGVNVATGNFDGDATTPDSLVTAPRYGGGPHIIIWNTQQNADGTVVVTGIRQQFMAFDPRFLGGVNITCGDLDGDGKAELICAAGPSGGPHVRIYSPDANGNLQLVNEFFAYDPSFRGGVTVASGQGYDTLAQFQQDVTVAPVATTPYPAGQQAPGAAQGIPLNSFDFNTFLPAVTVAGGGVQYLSANLLNSYNQIAYRPDLFIPPDLPNPTNQGKIVYATWSDTTPMSNYPTDGSRPPTTVTVGPYIQLGTTGTGTPVITRMTPPTGQITTRNVLVTGAGAGGGPDVRIWGFNGTGASLQFYLGNEFFAFDPNFRGGIDVSINDVISSPATDGPNATNGQVEPGRFDYTQPFPPPFLPETTNNSGAASSTPLGFPIDPDLLRRYTPEITVSMTSGGSQARIFADFNPLVPDTLNPFSSNLPTVRTALNQINFVPALVDRMTVQDLGNPLNNFQSFQSTTVFNRGINPQYTGGMNSAWAAFTFAGSANDVFVGTRPPPNAPGTGVDTNPVLAQSVFSAGYSPTAINAGSEVQIFNQMSEISLTSLPALSALYTPLDSFFGFNSYTGVGVSTSFGFGALPAPTIDRVTLPVITPGLVSNPILI
jgi:hypothetical protein